MEELILHVCEKNKRTKSQSNKDKRVDRRMYFQSMNTNKMVNSQDFTGFGSDESIRDVEATSMILTNMSSATKTDYRDNSTGDILHI